jgi:hypothetical protein
MNDDVSKKGTPPLYFHYLRWFILKINKPETNKQITIEEKKIS